MKDPDVAIYDALHEQTLSKSMETRVRAKCLREFYGFATGLMEEEQARAAEDFDLANFFIGLNIGIFDTLFALLIGSRQDCETPHAIEETETVLHSMTKTCIASTAKRLRIHRAEQKE